MSLDLLFKPPRSADLLAAFQAAFADEGSLRTMLRIRLDLNLDNVASPGDRLDQVIVSILFYEGPQGDTEGYRESLLKAACLERPRSPALCALAAEFGIAIPSPPPPPSGTDSQPGSQDCASDPVLAYDSEIRSAATRAGLVNDLKWLHDQVDQIRRLVYMPLQGVARRLPAPDAMAELGRHLSLLQSARARMVEKVEDGTFSRDDFPWIEEDLADAEADAKQALITASAAPLAQTVELLRNIVEVELANINGQLAAAGRALDLSGFIDRMRELRPALAPKMGRAGCARFDSDLQLLEEAEAKLCSLMSEHTRWQRIDDLVNNLNNMLMSPVSAAASSWRPLKRRLEAIADRGSIPGLAGLAQAESEIGAAIDAGDQTRLLIAFPGFSTIVRDHFTGLDKSLLLECGQVRTVGSGLQAVVEALRD